MVGISILLFEGMLISLDHYFTTSLVYRGKYCAVAAPILLSRWYNITLVSKLFCLVKMDSSQSITTNNVVMNTSCLEACICIDTLVEEDVIHDTGNLKKEKNTLQKQLSDATDHTFDMNTDDSDRSLDMSLQLFELEIDAADDDAVDTTAVTNDDDTTYKSSKFNKKIYLALTFLALSLGVSLGAGLTVRHYLKSKGAANKNDDDVAVVTAANVALEDCLVMMKQEMI